MKIRYILRHAHPIAKSEYVIINERRTTVMGKPVIGVSGKRLHKSSVCTMMHFHLLYRGNCKAVLFITFSRILIVIMPFEKRRENRRGCSFIFLSFARGLNVIEPYILCRGIIVSDINVQSHNCNIVSVSPLVKILRVTKHLYFGNLQLEILKKRKGGQMISGARGSENIDYLQSLVSVKEKAESAAILSKLGWQGGQRF